MPGFFIPAKVFMATFKLEANPTFKAKVLIPVPGEKVAEVEFIFKHRTQKAFDEWLETADGKTNVDVTMDIACGWELADPFDAESIEKLFQNYMGSPKALINTYISELTSARLGN